MMKVPSGRLSSSALIGQPLPRLLSSSSTSTTKTIQEQRAIENSRKSYHVYINTPCDFAVSNDFLPSSIEDEDIELIHDYCQILLPSGCISEFKNDADDIYYPLNIAFQYEILFHSDWDFESAIAKLELAMLRHLAAVTGLVECKLAPGSDNPAFQPPPPLPQDGDTTSSPPPPQPSGPTVQVEAISVYPTDQRDGDPNTCLYISNDETINGDYVCQPTEGFVTIYVNNNESSSLDKTTESSLIEIILQVIQEGMESDYYVDDTSISKVTFVPEESISSSNGAIPVPEEQKPNNNNGNPQDEIITGITPYDPDNNGAGDGNRSTIIGSISGLLLLFLLLLIINRRREEKEEDDAKSLSSINAAEIPGSLADADSLALQPMAAGDRPMSA